MYMIHNFLQSESREEIRNKIRGNGRQIKIPKIIDSSVESSDHDNQERAKTKSKATKVYKQKVISISRSLACMTIIRRTKSKTNRAVTAILVQLQPTFRFLPGHHPPLEHLDDHGHANEKEQYVAK